MLVLALAMLADAATAQPTAAAMKPKMICRTYDETGSLVKKQRVCRSASDWSKVEEDMQNEAERQRPHISAQKGG